MACVHHSMYMCRCHRSVLTSYHAVSEDETQVTRLSSTYLYALSTSPALLTTALIILQMLFVVYEIMVFMK